MSETPAKYLATPPPASGFTTLTPAQVEAERRSAYEYAFTNASAIHPPLLRPLNPDEHRENKQLSDALTQAKIQLGDRHAELRMMRVAVDVLTTRALKAEAALEVEQAKTALLWPVATKQTPSDK